MISKIQVTGAEWLIQEKGYDDINYFLEYKCKRPEIKKDKTYNIEIYYKDCWSFDVDEVLSIKEV